MLNKYNLDLSKVRSIGFDLDGTLYPLTGKINDRIRDKVSEKVLERKPELKNVENARSYFEERYQKIGSATNVLKEIGYKEPRKIINHYLDNMDYSGIIEPNPTLNQMIKKLGGNYEIYLLTRNPKKAALNKLSEIGIEKDSFNFFIFDDSHGIETKLSGKGFDKALELSKFPKPENHVYIGNSEKRDIIPAGERGMETILVGKEKSKIANATIHNISELEKLFL